MRQRNRKSPHTTARHARTDGPSWNPLAPPALGRRRLVSSSTTFSARWRLLGAPSRTHARLPHAEFMQPSGRQARDDTMPASAARLSHHREVRGDNGMTAWRCGDGNHPRPASGSARVSAESSRHSIPLHAKRAWADKTVSAGETTDVQGDGLRMGCHFQSAPPESPLVRRLAPLQLDPQCPRPQPSTERSTVARALTGACSVPCPGPRLDVAPRVLLLGCCRCSRASWAAILGLPAKM